MTPGADPAPHVLLPHPLLRARFRERPNRFLVRAELDEGPEAGRVVDTHLPDPGRLKELLLPDARLWLEPADAPGRKTRFTTRLVERPEGGGRVSLDTTLPNRLVHRALEAAALPELDGWTLERAEWSHGASRFDFLLRREAADDPGRDRRGTAPSAATGGRVREGAGGADRLVLEVKSVTLVEEGRALFPDAVTARGARHVRELAELAGTPEYEAAVLFVLQRPDADRIVAARAIDPTFADTLAEAEAAGVRVLGRRCRIEADRVVLGEPVPAGAG